MKRSILFFSTFTLAYGCLAQTQCSSDNPLFRFDNSGSPRAIRTLGSAPEFPFLENLSTPAQVYAKIKRCEKNGEHRRDIARLNDMLVQAGFINGIEDLKTSSITKETIPSGTVGNMGSKGYTTMYAKLEGNHKSWKITSGSGCYMYLLARCGNAFYPQSGLRSTACIDVPVNIVSDPKEVTLDDHQETTNEIYVYYHIKRRKHSKYETWNKEGEIADTHPSRPLLLSELETLKVAPGTFRITVTSPEGHAKVCPNKQTDIPANINVEKTSEYTGNYPSAKTTHKEYRRISKRAYKKSLRKMRKVHKKEHRITKLTHVRVSEENKG